MTLPEELLEAIVARPDEQAAYVVAADWLSAQGNAWGELISTQVRLSGETDPARFLTLRRRAEELLRQHGERWLGAPGLEAVWRWGFVERLTLPHLDLLSRVRTAEAGALARELVLPGSPLQLAAALTSLSQHPLRRLEALTLSGTGRISTALPPLRRLACVGVALDWAALPAALEELRVSDVRDGSLAGWLSATTSTCLTRLELLDLELPHAAIHQIVERQDQLRTLHLEDDLPDALARWLAESPALARLEHLALGGPATDDGLEAIVTHFARFSRLERLVLYGGRFGATLRRHAYRALPRIVFAQRRPAADWTQPRGRRE